MVQNTFRSGLTIMRDLAIWHSALPHHPFQTHARENGRQNSREQTGQKTLAHTQTHFQCTPTLDVRWTRQMG